MPLKKTMRTERERLVDRGFPGRSPLPSTDKRYGKMGSKGLRAQSDVQARQAKRCIQWVFDSKHRGTHRYQAGLVQLRDCHSIVQGLYYRSIIEERRKILYGSR